MNSYTIRFACGARINAAELPQPSHTRRDGSYRLAVYDSEGGLMMPTFETPGAVDGRAVRAPCLFGCPKKRASGRKKTKCFPTVETEPGNVRAWRHVVTCYARTDPQTPNKAAEYLAELSAPAESEVGK